MSEAVKDLDALGWFGKKNGKAIVIRYQSVDGTIGYRYKGKTALRNTSRKSFLKRFTQFTTPQ